MLTTLLISLAKTYQFAVSPFIGKTCRFEPTCSNYFISSLGRHGLFWGLVFFVKRLSCCHPFSKKSMFDPVP